MKQSSSENPSILMLNDDCLSHIFKLIPLEDYVNLAETCSRLLRIGQNFLRKYKNIEVIKWNDGREDGSSGISKQDFSNILSVIGDHVTSVHIYPVSFDILKRLAECCSNLSIVKLGDYRGLLRGPLPFRNLKELEVWGDFYLSIDDWKNCFANNPGIENLAWYYNRDYNCIPLLTMLSKLKSLRINYLELYPAESEINSDEINHLSCLPNLTKFSFWSRCTNNRLLILLAEKLKLVQLEFVMDCDEDTFATLKYFLHLEVLSIRAQNNTRVPEAAIFSTMLKHIKLECINISCSVFLLIVNQLKHLEEFDMGIGKIFWDNDECKSRYENYAPQSYLTFAFC